ncbi:CHAT domain-containing protein [Chloroflexus aggregans]|uniref:CHAT domain-containing protein n=1 Tax=Chloroflexus aggregans TaxID=152260 RepID=UPI0000E74BEA|nr:CHAT domain-containing protein [Chloroflexus aggregans]
MAWRTRRIIFSAHSHLAATHVSGSLTGLGGWAARLVGEYGVGALIAPLWVVNDQIAYEFARTFYTATQTPGMTLAAALRQARRQAKEAYPDDPTWLAYSLYAHPNARLTWNRASPADD